jgi:hypothetical protein
VQFPAQAVGLDLEIEGFVALRESLHVLEDHPAGAGQAGLAAQVGEEVELSGGEVHVVAVHGGFALHRIEMPRADLEAVGRFRPAECLA